MKITDRYGTVLRCYDNGGRGDAVTGIYNALAWYVLEEVCRSYVDLLD